MNKDSTTDAADNQDVDSTANADDNQSTDQDKATTDQQTADKDSDNLDTSESTDKSDDEDKDSKTDDADDTSATKFDDDLDDWAKKTKRAVPTTDAERALLQEIRDGQRQFSRDQQAKDNSKEIDKAVKDAKPEEDDDDDDRTEVEKLNDRINESENLRMRSEYFTEKEVTAEESKIMGEILQEKVDKGGKAAYDYWTNPEQLEDWHTLAKARLSTSGADKTAIEQEAARKERDRIAKESQANNGASRNASTQGATKKTGYDRTAFLKSDD